MADPEARSCQNCQQPFEIFPEDSAFYQKIDVPVPTFCPPCRLQRRLTWRNDRSLFGRQCDLCSKQIIALYPANTPFPVYCNACWYSDRWDGIEFGRDYDFAQPFFAQFRQLLEVVPRLALQLDNCQNCDFSNQLANSKSCYLCTSGSGAENCYYCHRTVSSKDSMDCLLVTGSERCFDSVAVRDSFDVHCSFDVANSRNLWFCADVRGSRDCFMSANLRRAEYVFRGQQLSKAEYEQRLAAIDVGSADVLAQLQAEFADLRARQLYAPGEYRNCTASSGTFLANTARSRHSFYGSNLEDCAYTQFADDAKDTYDVNNVCCGTELHYEVSTGGVNAYNVRFSVDTWPNVRDVLYSDSCRGGVSDLFGCISLRKQQHCILNKQYAKEEYEALAPKIIEQMNAMSYVDAKGREYRYGEFFPAELSPFAYNQSSAMEYFPLSKEQVIDRGYSWDEGTKRQAKPDLVSSELPDRVKDADGSYASKVIQCAHATANGRGDIEVGCQQQCTLVYKLTPSELGMRLELQLTLPRLCPNCRHHERLALLQPYQLWQRQCVCEQADHDHQGVCPNQFKTSYPPDRSEMVYCEDCYQKEVV